MAEGRERAEGSCRYVPRSASAAVFLGTANIVLVGLCEGRVQRKGDVVVERRGGLGGVV